MSRIVIDGNIGSGKTTQLDLLEKKGWFVKREPIDEWPLEKFYKDPKKWAFYLHMIILKTLRPIRTAKPVIYERCLLSSRWVFWPILMRTKGISKEEDEIYTKFYEDYGWHPDLYIFLAKSPEKAFEHVKKRGQAGDSGVTLAYMKELDVEYKNLIRSVPCRVIMVNAERTAEEIHNEICRHLSENELFISNSSGEKMQKTGGSGGKMQCTPLTNMCRLS
jgi:deoxyadenosine/deoxycytidine kinase